MKLYNEPPKRFFAFGCSFTQYGWPTWADFVALEAGPGTEYYNFGRSGAGNQYIANTIAQADSKYNFTKDDLVMVCWSNVHREDRIFYNEQETPAWTVPGNLTTQEFYDQEWLDKFGTCPDWFFMRDFASIHLVTGFLNKTNSHQLSMVDIHNTWDQYLANDNPITEKNIGSIAFPAEKQKILPSFYKTLWNNKLGNKLKNDMKRIHPCYADYHPTPDEHFLYLKKIFKKHKWSKSTALTEKVLMIEFVQYMKKLYKNNNIQKVTTPYDVFQIEGDTDLLNNLQNLPSKYFIQSKTHLFL